MNHDGLWPRRVFLHRKRIIHSDGNMKDTEENLLEQALRLAATQPARRPDFYKLLLESPIYVLWHSDDSSAGRRVFQPGEKLSILSWRRNDESSIIPFFTSLAALRNAIDEETAYMELSARSLFELVKNASLILNPKSPYAKEFTPNEIAAMLVNGVNRLSEERVVERETSVLLGQPANYPTRMVDALTALLARRVNANAAYLAQMHDPSQDEKPHLLIGIEADGDIELLIQEIGVVAGDTAPDGVLVDLIRVERGDYGLSTYLLRQVTPFYKRNWIKTLKNFLGFGRA